jgi:two-component system, NarL family, sensor histidine kinase UhpB
MTEFGGSRRATDPWRPHRWRWPHSLYGRLVLVPTALLVLGLLCTIGIIFLHAKGRIAAEVTSSLQLGHDLATAALRNVADADSPAKAFESLMRDLPRGRHVQFDLKTFATGSSPESQSQIGDVVYSYSQILAPLLAPPPVLQAFPVVVRGLTVGQLSVSSNPTNEIAEIIGEVELVSAVLIGLCVLTVGGLLITVRQSLRPLEWLSDGFDRLEREDYQHIAAVPVLELEHVGRQFNLLAESLQRVTSDNRLLIDRLFSMQDKERKEIAAELHDEFGPVLFAIRAEAACIMKSAACDGEFRTHAQSIAELTDSIQRVNYRMLERLRPMILEQMGLRQALEQLIAFWRSRYTQVSWSLQVHADFDDWDEVVNLTLYRAAQEGITNAMRHGQPSAIKVSLKYEPTGDVVLAIEDNGRGLPQSVRYGFGLLGMTDRVRQLRGSLSLRSVQPGVVVEVRIPQREQSLIETPHANPAD